MHLHAAVPSERRRQARFAVVAIVAAGLVGTIELAPARADQRTSDSPTVDVAVVSPTLATAEAGASIGMPLACSVAASIAAQGAPGAAPIIREATALCDASASSGSQNLAILNSQLTALEVLNPAADAAIETFAKTADALAGFGASFGPFGPDVATIGPDLRYFEAP